MKARLYILLIVVTALATVLIGSCTKIQDPEDEWPELGGARPVLFRSSLATLATKSTTLPDNTTFGVFAFYQPGTPGNPGTWNSTRTPDFMFNQAVLFNLPDLYSYSPLRYWPSNEYNTITFWAYCPYTEDPVLLTANTNDPYTISSAGIPDIRFTADGQSDFMVSDRVDNQIYTSNTTNNGIVPLHFNHVLSKIDIKADKYDPDGKFAVTLNSVSFKGLYQTATLGFRSPDWTWSNFGSSRGDISVWTGAVVLDHNVPSQVLGSVMPLPQSLSNDAARLQVTFCVSYEDPSDHTTHSYTTTREVYLSDAFSSVGGTWVMNSHYTLTIKITPGNPIQFTVSWDNWGAEHNYHLSS